MTKKELENEISKQIVEFEKDNPAIGWIDITKKSPVGFSNEKPETTASVKFKN